LVRSKGREVFLCAQFSPFHSENCAAKNSRNLPEVDLLERGFTMEKSERIFIRVGLLDKEIIKQKANEVNLSVSEYMVRTALGRNLPRAMTNEELQAYLELKKFQTNFTRISNFIKHKADEEMKSEIKEMLEEIKQLKLFKNG